MGEKDDLQKKLPIGLFCLLSLLLLSQISLPFLLSWESLRFLFEKTIYWNCWALLLIGVFLFLFRGREFGLAWSRIKVLLLSFGVALFLSGISLLFSPRLRTLADEATLVATAKAFAERQSPEIITEQFPRGEGFQTLFRMVDKRPPGFPFLVHLLNVARGYSIENAFLLNLGLGCICLSIVAFLLIENFGIPFALSSLFLLAAQPLFFYVVRSGALDMLNLVMMLLLVLALQAYLKRPGRARFEFLSYFLVAVLFTRYESAVASAAIALALAFKGHLNREHLKNGWYFILLAIMPCGVVLQRAVATSMEQEADLPAFSWYYLVMNNVHLLQQSLRVDAEYSLLSPLVMFPALCGSLFLLRRSWNPRTWSFFQLLLILSFLGMWLVITALYAGILNNGISSRYFLLFLLLSAMAAAWFIEFFLSTLSQEKGRLLAPVLSAGLLLASLPRAIQMNAHYALTSERSLEFVDEVIAKEDLRPILYISEIPILFTIRETGSISFGALRSGISHVQELLKQNQDPKKSVLVLQYLFEETGNPLPGLEIPDGFVVQPLAEFTEHGRIVRLSRLRFS